MKTSGFVLGIALMLASAAASAADVHRMWNGRYHFYTTSFGEAQNLQQWGWAVLESANYFGTDDAPPTWINSRELLRCYSAERNHHTYMLRDVFGQACERVPSYVTEHSMGYVRSRQYSESAPLAGRGRPIYAMYQAYAKDAQGRNISRLLLTVNPTEAAQLCGNYWMPAEGAHFRTCLLGYVAY